MNAMRFVGLALVASVIVFSCSAKTYRWRGGGDGVHWSDPANWVDNNTFQSIESLESSAASTTLFFYTDPEDANNPAVYAFDTVNDLGPDFRMANLQVGGYARSFHVSGDPIYTAGITDNVSYYPSAVFTFDCDVYACGTNSTSIRSNNFTCQPGHVRYFNGLVSHERDLSDANVGVGSESGGKFDPATGASGTYITYSGGGTNVFNGCYRFIGNNSNWIYSNSQDYFDGGTAIMNCDCIESWFNYKNGVNFIIGPKGVVRKVNTSPCDFWQLCTIDIYGRLFTNQAIPGQAGGTSTFNIHEGGLWDVATSFRIANNQPTIINVDGGVLMLRNQGYALGDGSYGVINMKRGLLSAGSNGASALYIGHGGSSYKASGTAGADDEKRCTVNFDGGVTACQYLYDTTPAAAIMDRNRDNFFNGGILRIMVGGNVYRYGGGFTTDAQKATTKAYLRAGGLKVDTTNKAVVWNKALEVKAGDTAGPVVKYGSGTLEVGADMTAARQAFVTGGVFTVNAAANWTGSVTLAPGTTLALASGTELALDGLESDNGIVRLAADQRLSLASAPVVAAGKGLVFDVPTATDGAYTLIACDEAMASDLPAKCAVVAQAEAKAPELAAEQPSADFVSAEDQVQADLEKMNLSVGADPQKKAIIQIGSASVMVKDPANDKAFGIVREQTANIAYLNAKAEVIKAINADFSAVDRVSLMTDESVDENAEKVAAAKEAVEAKRAELAETLAQYNEADAKSVSEVTLNDRFNSFLDAVIKKIDNTYSPEAIAAKKQITADAAKAEAATLKEKAKALYAEYKVLEEAAAKLPKDPAMESASSAKIMSKMPLLGSSILTQAESWDKNEKVYTIALAIVWSPKLQEAAAKMGTGDFSGTGKPGKFSKAAWVKAQDWSSMVGARRFTDDQGRNLFVGISSVELTGPVVKQNAKKKIADTMAIKNVAMSLLGDIETYREASQNMKIYADDSKAASQKLTENTSAKVNINLKGCMQLASKTLKHPISGKKIYVSAYYIDPTIAAEAGKMIEKAYADAIRVRKHTNKERGKHAGMQQAYGTVKQDTTAFNQGAAEGAAKVNAAVAEKDAAAAMKTTVKKTVTTSVTVKKSTGAAGSAPQEKATSKGGTFSGGTIDTDF